MRSLRTPRALEAPACRRYISSTPSTCLHASSPNYRGKEQTTKPSRGRAQKKPAPWIQDVVSGHRPKVDARLDDREKHHSENQVHDPRTRLRVPIEGKLAKHHALLRKTVLARLQDVLNDLTRSEQSGGDAGKERLQQEAILFMNSIDNAFLLAQQNITRKDKNPLFWNLRDAFIQGHNKALIGEVRYAFQSFMVRNRFSRGMDKCQKNLLDFRFPQEWLPGTREMQRTIHVHVGPTNSGKTYNALKALENAKSGVYAGPLRLLATEVYHRLTAKGLPCALITGEEVRLPDTTDQYFSSCTVEMVPLNGRVDVAVIDEIQMIGDSERGNAWTMAFLGIQAKEMHVCGEERAVKLIESLCASIGDKCIVHRYERLSPLATMDDALGGDLSQLEKGDCVVAFSRLSLHTLKRSIERHTGRRCAIVYGSLPPEVRVQQAALFNDPDNDYDYIVASDAIGMGLNLEIRRVIMESIFKFDGAQNRTLSDPEIKQIGGRAGRFRTASRPSAENESSQGGLVTTMDYDDLVRVQDAFSKHVPDIEHAYIEAPPGIIERFASYYPPETPLSFLLMRIRTAAAIGEQYKLSLPNDRIQLADLISEFPLTICDKLTLCFVPTRLSSERGPMVIRAMAKILATNAPGDLLSIKEIPLEYLDMDMSEPHKHGADYLEKLEELHVSINSYVWLSYRFTSVFRDQALAFHVRSLVEERLIDILDKLDFTEQALYKRRQYERRKAQTDQMSQEMMRQEIEDGMMENGFLPEDEVASRLEELVEASRGAANANRGAEDAYHGAESS
ncbi:unnamed protein product [Clonostachys chloroleuca]|uniref:RNA helicase n=1 Tax=Clonostachys chloroleuca TaxID=1926264 RepID=A0AA35LWC7_9HYPO|nr:unnamed protein product [Clonostachys chloroleuca]